MIKKSISNKKMVINRLETEKNLNRCDMKGMNLVLYYLIELVAKLNTNLKKKMLIIIMIRELMKTQS